MKLKDFKTLLLILFIGSNLLQAQYKISGNITNSSGKPLRNVEIYDKTGGQLARSNEKGSYEIVTSKKNITLLFFSYEYEVIEKKLSLLKNTIISVQLTPLSKQLSEVEVKHRRAKVFELKRLKDVEETAIYAGKKTEVILVNQSMANLASNNARQIYSQIAGLNIYQNDDAGLQLNIGGRGLDPNRTANFNTRQNGYDISADVLGYPESYYTPASEGLAEVQIIRGAASLQYGTQFGGLVNFIMKKPNRNKPLELITRNTIGSNNLYTNFTSVSGTKKKWSYYTFFNYKKGNGFRPNSNFESKNVYAHIGYQFSEKTKLTANFTHLYYLAKQAGGLTDAMFNQNPFQSNRERNWFRVNWLLYNLKLTHKFSKKTNYSIQFFGLKASRYALGFRTNRVDQLDVGGERDLIKGDFNNFGLETRLLHHYKISNKKNVFLIGGKFYKSNNTGIQGPGTNTSNPDFTIAINEFPNYTNQSNYTYPNLNVALFGENIVYLTNKLSVTPGFRLEHIKTESEGYYKKINTDAAGNVILNETIFDNRKNERTFILLGLGIGYKLNENIEWYGNVSQNYRSVTFSDISVVNPAFLINPNIEDEKGFTLDVGTRGNYKNSVSYDVSAFALFYKNRIGFIQRLFPDGNVKSERGNVGDAVMYGVESLFDFNLNKMFIKNKKMNLNFFVNTSIIDSKYTKSKENGVENNKVEFIPDLNVKTGIKFGYNNFLSTIQYTYLGQQFTDASNAKESNLSGVIGQIPQYDVIDVSVSYKYKQFKIQTGVNNLLNNYYFTRRATGYPGPGILPSADRNYYLTLQIKI